jgi:hypothetical protein
MKQEKIKIELTDKEYKTLLKILYCGEWVLNSYKTNQDKIYRETESLEQYIFSFADKAGLGKWIELDADTGMYFPTPGMEEELDKYIDKYDRIQLKTVLNK